MAHDEGVVHIHRAVLALRLGVDAAVLYTAADLGFSEGDLFHARMRTIPCGIRSCIATHARPLEGACRTFGSDLPASAEHLRLQLSTAF